MRDPAYNAFLIVTLVVFVDAVGQHFMSPALVPLARSLGADEGGVALLLTSRSIAALVSGFWLPLVADTRGRKVAMFLSCLGSTAGYFMQGSVLFCSAEFGRELLLYGKIVEGLFSQTMPAALGYISDITPDLAQLRTRTTTVYAMNQIVPVAIAPIGGLVATFGLQLPALSAGGLASFAVLLVVLFMQESDDVNDAARRYAYGAFKKDASSSATGTATASASSAEADDEADVEAEAEAEAEALRANAPSVWCDPNLLCLGFGFACFAVAITCNILLVPYHLKAHSTFGVQSEEDAAKALGVIGIPSGVMNIACMVLLYPHLLKRGVQNDVCAGVGGTVMGSCFLVYPLTRHIWHIVLLNVVLGIGTGVFFGAISNAPSPYLATKHPHKVSQGRAVYLQFLTVGLICAPLALAEVVTRGSLAVGFVLGGIVFIFGSIVVALVVRRMSRYMDRVLTDSASSHKRLSLTPQARAEASSTGALPPAEFCARLAARIQVKLEERHYHLWNARIQALVEQLIDKALPPLHEWNPRFAAEPSAAYVVHGGVVAGGDDAEAQRGRGRGDSDRVPIKVPLTGSAGAGERWPGVDAVGDVSAGASAGLLHLRDVARLLVSVGEHEAVRDMERRHEMPVGSLSGVGVGGVGADGLQGGDGGHGLLASMASGASTGAFVVRQRRQRGATSRTASTRTAGSGASELESVAAVGQGSTMLTGDSKALAAV